MSGCTWIISERGDRWRRTIDQFAPRLFGDRGERFCVGPRDIAEAVERHTPRGAIPRRLRRSSAAAGGGSLPAAPPPVVVLAELPLESPRESLAAVARCAALERPPLLLVALPAELPLAGRTELELIAAVRQLGAGAVLRHPEQLWQLARLVTRYAQTEY